jgi:hypothetical protein
MVKKFQRVNRASANRVYNENDSFMDEIIEDAEHFLNAKPHKNAKSAKYVSQSSITEKD